MDDINPNTRLESLKKKIFAQNEDLIPGKKEGTFSQKSFDVSDTWNDMKTESSKKTKNYFKAPSSLFKKFFIGAVFFLILGVIYAFAMLYLGENTVSTERVKITITGNAFTAGGEELPIDITVKNLNSVSIDSAELIIEYPRGSSETDFSDYERKRVSLSSIAPGEEINEHITVILYGQQGTTKNIRARLEYTVRGSVATFTKEETYTIQINTAPLVLTVDAPVESVSNQLYEFKVKAVVASNHLGSDTAVRVDYPPGFQFSDATPNPIRGNNVFPLQKTDVGAENVISIRGKLIGINGDRKAFRVSAGERDSNDEAVIAVVYNSTVHEVQIGRPFVDARLTVGGQDKETYAIDPGDRVEAKIEWSNNLPTEVNNLEIRAKLYGNALNKTTIVSSGFYDSNSDSVVWDKNSLSALASVQSGDHGTLSLRFQSMAVASGTTTMLSDPTITVEISVRGSQPEQGVSSREVNSFEKKTFRVNTDLQLTGKTLYSTGPMTNTGPVPPKAGEETTYTLEWKITNTNNRVSKAEVRATLPTNVTFVKKDSSSGENLDYNDTTREITWSVGSIARGSGIVTAAKTVAFQVKLRPSTSQVNTTPNLLNEAVLVATDSFTDTAIRKTTGKLTTLVTGEPNFPPAGGKVVQ